MAPVESKYSSGNTAVLEGCLNSEGEHLLQSVYRASCLVTTPSSAEDPEPKILLQVARVNKGMWRPRDEDSWRKRLESYFSRLSNCLASLSLIHRTLVRHMLVIPALGR